jgi:hypothetical protein
VERHPSEPGHDAHGIPAVPRGVLASNRPLPTPSDEDVSRLVRIGRLVDELTGMGDSYDDLPPFEPMRPHHG